MNKKILLGISGLCAAFCGLALADEFQFTCPTPSQLFLSPGEIYATDLNGMPQNLVGNRSGHDTSWSGSPVVSSPATTGFGSVDSATFTAVTAFQQTSTTYYLSCGYNLKGVDRNGNPVEGNVTMFPGNAQFPTMYAYSLSNGAMSSTANSMKVIATTLN